MSNEYALIKWVSGADKDTYSASVPVQWIKDFDFSKWEKDEKFDPEETYAIEWRNTAKPPKGGWRCYDGIIIQISSNKRLLEKTFANIQGKASEKETDSASCSSMNIICNPNSISESPAKQPTKVEDVMMAIANLEAKMQQHHLEISRNIERLYEEMHINNMQSKATLREISKFSGKTNDGPTEIDNKVEIAPQSGVFVTKIQWLDIEHRSTYTSMGIALVLALFPVDVLLKSNLKGGSCKIKNSNESTSKSKNEEKKLALDPKIMEAIKDCVKAKFHDKYNESSFGMAINNKLSSLRRKTRALDATNRINENTNTKKGETYLAETDSN